MPKLETNVVRKIRAEIEKNGGRSIKIHGDQLMNGEPDIVASLPVRLGNSFVGATIVIECKQNGKKPTAIQTEILDRWRRAGAIAFWSDDASEVIDIITKELKCRLEGNGLTTLRDFRPIQP